MEQYPDTIVITVTTPATQDANGSWVSGGETIYTFDCRAEVNSSGRKIVGDDGVTMDYSMICYCPTDGDVSVSLTTNDDGIVTKEAGESVVVDTFVSSMMYGAESSYKLTNRIGEVHEGTVKRWFLGQLNARLWL